MRRIAASTGDIHLRKQKPSMELADTSALSEVAQPRIRRAGTFIVQVLIQTLFSLIVPQSASFPLYERVKITMFNSRSDPSAFGKRKQVHTRQTRVFEKFLKEWEEIYYGGDAECLHEDILHLSNPKLFRLKKIDMVIHDMISHVNINEKDYS